MFKASMRFTWMKWLREAKEWEMCIIDRPRNANVRDFEGIKTSSVTHIVDQWK
jgi:hypothetical protein